MKITIVSLEILDFLNAYPDADTAFNTWAKIIFSNEPKPKNFSQLSSSLSRIYPKIGISGSLTTFGIGCGRYLVSVYVSYRDQEIYVYSICEQAVYGQKKKE